MFLTKSSKIIPLKINNSEYPLIIAHRGGPGLGYHENTLDAFKQAASLGVPMLECDIHRTADGVFVCHHDPNIGELYIQNATFAECKIAAQEKGYELCTLLELLETLRGKIRFDLELKEVGYERDFVRFVCSLLGYDDFVVKSFEDATVRALKLIDARIKTGLLVERRKSVSKVWQVAELLSWEARLLATGADFLGIEECLWNIATTLRMRLLKKELYVWTVNSSEKMVKLFPYVDAIITDYPDVALSVFADYRNKTLTDSE